MGLLERYQLTNDSKLPVRLGSVLRVPSYAYHKWGIKGSEQALRRESERGYEVEWLGLDGKGGSPQQMKYVVQAITSTGLGNYSQMLRDKGAEVVSFLVREVFRGKQVRYLETGAGVSTETVIKKLVDDGVDLERVFFTLVEPGSGRIEATAAKLESTYRLTRDKKFKVINARDLDIPQYIEEGSQDIALAVAAHHHHAFLDEPTKAAAYALSPGGVFVTSDWHNSLWEDPARVYHYLQQSFEWETKEGDLREFAQRFLQGVTAGYSPSDPLNDASNEDIRKFWKGWASVRAGEISAGRFNLNDDILMLEGHRPAERYVDEFDYAGLQTERTALAVDALIDSGTLATNPHKVLPTGSRILMVTVGQKK